MPKFGTKNISCGYFRARIKKKTIAIFEIAPSFYLMAKFRKIIWVFLGWNLKPILLCFKTALSNFV